jgi:putative phage-type endonuclease
VNHKCSVLDCSNDMYARGLCISHYARWKRHGDPLAGRMPHGTALKYVNNLRPMNAAVLDDIDYRKQRQKYLGGSDAGAILGLSPWRTPYECWLDKTTPPAPPDPKRQKFFTRGKRLEPVVLDMMREETGFTVATRNQRYIDSEHDFMACEIDAETDAGENVEIKTVHPFLAKKWGEEDTDEIPPVYTAQAMHGLMVTKRRVCIFGVLIGADDLRTYRVERDDEVIAAMRAREVEFWNYVVTMTPPPLIRLTDVERMFGQDTGAILEVTDISVIDAINNLRSVKAQIKDLEGQKDTAEFTIKSAMADASVLTIGGKKACSWKAQNASRIDVTALRAAEPALAERFTKISQSRVFRLS